MKYISITPSTFKKGSLAPNQGLGTTKLLSGEKAGEFNKIAKWERSE